MGVPRVAKTAAAGLAATWFMDRVDKLIYKAQPEAVHRREAELEDLTGPGQGARAIMRASGHEPSHAEAVGWGRTVHLMFGTLTALIQPALAKRLPILRVGMGTVYGLAVYPANAVVVPALGLTPPTSKFPPETVIRGVGYHIGYGVALELLARLLGLHEDGRERS